MKKKIIIIASLVLIVAFIVCAWIFLPKRVKAISLTTIKNGYNYVSCEGEDDNYIVIPLMISNKQSNYTNLSKVKECFITENEEENMIKVIIKDIKLEEDSLIISKKEYYHFSFIFTIDDKSYTDYSICLKEASLVINYDFDMVKVKIGSFSYYKVPYFGTKQNRISLTNLKGIVNNYYEQKEIKGIVLGLRNNYNKDIVISGIESLDINYKTSFSEAKVLNSIPQSSDDISHLLGYEYDYTNIKNSNNNSFTIKPQETLYILIPLKKVGSYIANQFGLSIDFSINEMKETIYIDDFLYYSSDLRLKYEDFEISTYENH